MKTKPTKGVASMKLLTIALCMIVPTLTFAQGSGSQGGQGYKNKQTGKTRIADPNVIREEGPTDAELGEKFKISPELMVEVEKALRIMAVYAQVVPVPHNLGTNFYGPYNLYANAFRQDVLQTDYRLVDQIPEDCVVEKPKMKDETPESETLEHMACTLGKQTFLVRSMFLNTENLREQAKSIIHERLHRTEALTVLKAESKIADITDGLELAMTLLDRQVKGERPVLTEAQLTTLKTMQKRLQDYWIFGDRSSKDPTYYGRDRLIKPAESTITANGGGIIGTTTELGKNVYIGIATEVRYAKIGNNVTLVDSAWFCAPLWMRTGAFPEITGIKRFTCQIGSNTTISEAYSVMPRNKAWIGENALVNHVAGSVIMDLLMENNTAFEHSEIGMIGSWELRERRFRLRLTEGSSLRNLSNAVIAFRAKDLSLFPGVGGFVINFYNLGFLLNGVTPPVAMGVIGGVAAIRHFSSLMVPYYLLKVKGNIDAGGEVCAGGNIFKDNIGLKAVIESKQDLVDRCTEYTKSEKKYSR